MKIIAKATSILMFISAQACAMSTAELADALQLQMGRAKFFQWGQEQAHAYVQTLATDGAVIQKRSKTECAALKNVITTLLNEGASAEDKSRALALYKSYNSGIYEKLRTVDAEKIYQEHMKDLDEIERGAARVRYAYYKACWDHAGAVKRAQSDAIAVIMTEFAQRVGEIQQATV